MPNLSTTGSRMRVDKTTKLRFEYDKYLSSLEAKYTFQVAEKKINSNINEQKNVFKEEFYLLKEQLAALTEEIKLISEFKIEKENLEKKCEVLEMLSMLILILIFKKKLFKIIIGLDNTTTFNDLDEEIMSLFTSVASKVVIKNFKRMDETDLSKLVRLNYFNMYGCIFLLNVKTTV